MKKVGIVVGSTVGTLIFLLLLFFIEESYTDVILHGKNIVNVTVKEEYHDLGFDVFHNNKLVSKNKYEVVKKDDVDINTLGTYHVSYDIKYHFRQFHLERTVNVIDDVKPEITTNILTVERDYCSKKDKVKLTYSATDNYDGDLTDKILVEEKEDNINLTVIDSSGNENIKQIPITYTKKPNPIFKLKGNSTIYVVLNGKYQEQGAGYYDGCGNELKDKIIISGSVDTEKVGTYTLTYTLSNGSKLTRKVNVYKPGEIGKGKVIYLTFDDGPSVYTQKILDTLNKYNVKATFFVTNQFPGYLYQIKNEYNAGHSVAVHTYTHNYNIYKSVDAYINDFNKMNSVIEKYTGTRSKIFRFPGGSSNTVSYSYSRGVVSKVASQMLKDGYQYFDWDVSSGDAAGASRQGIYNNVVNGAKSCSRCIVLMHDIKPNTANELDNILKTLTERGYKFATLDINSPTVHHKIAN